MRDGNYFKKTNTGGSEVLVGHARGSNIGLAGCGIGFKIEAGCEKYSGWDTG